jgi:uracil-DNA glycosylase
MVSDNIEAAPHPQRRYPSIAALHRNLEGCRRCAAAGFQIESTPVVQGAAGRRAYLFGQAPGIVEGAEGAPWRGRAGRTLRQWLELDEKEFDATFYCASVTRCYPGRTAGGRGDRTPTPAERRLCASWQEEEVRLLHPALILTVGGLAARAIIGATTLTECVGKSYLTDDAIVIPLPHPSGASAWLNDRANRGRLGKAVTHARREIARLDDPS